MKNIVEDAEREKETEAQKALARQALNPASNGAEAKSETPSEPEGKTNTDSDTIHNLLHQGKDSLSTRFLSAGQPEIVALPPSTLSRDAANLVDPSFARSQLDSSWHHVDAIKAEVDKNEAAKAKLKKNESKRSKEFDFADLSKSEGQTRLYSGYSEEEPTLLAAQWHCTPDDTLIGSNSSPTEESFNRAAENVSTSPATLAWLSSLVSPEVRASVAANLQTPPETLRKLANDVDNTVRLSVATNPNTPSDVLRNLTRDASKLTASEAQSALCARGDVVEAERKSQNLLTNNRFNPTSNHLIASYTCLDAVMPDGINDGSKADSEWQSLNSDGAQKAYKQQKDTVKDLKFNPSVSNPNGPRDIAKELTPHSAFDSPPENASPQEKIAFLKMIATRLSTPPAKLAELAQSESIEIRAAVAENINTPAEAFALLAKDSQAQVKLRVIDNSNCPSHVLELLKDDQDPYVGYEAKNQLKRIQNSLAQERSGNYRTEGLL
ncbi:MAG: hypothetical protein Q8T09_10770 [Candidatus Melainabacteria bacterium]|nr:hypothetical protein [Candidatus Melainabacteria bacterium]